MLDCYKGMVSGPEVRGWCGGRVLSRCRGSRRRGSSSCVGLAWLDGAEVLIRCQAGMNRSGLVTALVLVMAGLTPAQAVALIRRQRGSARLFNQHFVTWLVNPAETAVGLG